MRTFNDILREARSRGTLYHITNYVGLYKIFEEDKLKFNKMSLTRDKSLWYFHGCPVQTFFQLVVDGDALSERFQIKPYADGYEEIGTSSREWKHWTNEHEEQIWDHKHTYFKGFWSKFVIQVNFNEAIFMKDFKMLGGDRPDETEESFGLTTPAGFFLNVARADIGKRYAFLSDYIELIEALDKPIKMLKSSTDVVSFLKDLKGKRY
jgi:hypothetical protein